ncbi:tail fiber assembly protein [Enterobacter cancerogenus]|uniref:tail fiber assembly protein n=1 Tax=Enterobacter cancerogenus TaxID=69218 RepID=UPI003805FCAD
MNNTYFYSAMTNAFYASSLLSDYEGAGTLPDDISEISAQWYEHLISGQAMGKEISSNEYNQPVLSEPPPPTPQELRAVAEGKKSQLMRETGEAIAILQDAVDLGISTEEENELLLALRSYRVLVSRVDVDNPVWPEKP